MILWINTYFPTDQGLVNFDETVLQYTLSGVNWLIENNKFDHILWNGDINSDFNRNSRFVTIVRNFITEKGYEKACENFHFDFTYCSPTETSFSKVDHFIYNRQLAQGLSIEEKTCRDSHQYI